MAVPVGYSLRARDFGKRRLHRESSNEGRSVCGMDMLAHRRSEEADYYRFLLCNRCFNEPTRILKAILA